MTPGPLFALAFASALAIGCSSSSLPTGALASPEPPPGAPADAGSKAAPDPPSDAGRLADAPADAPTCALPKPPAPPGPEVTDFNAKGVGACASKTLRNIVDAIHGAHPELADIPGPGGSGRIFYAYALPAGGIALVFLRGQGADGESTNPEYWYFETDSGCAPKQVGHYQPIGSSGSACIKIVGSPMWATPVPPDPKYICGADLSPKDISGTFALCGQGQRVACTDRAASERPMPFPSALGMTIAQRADDRSKGTVTLTGTGHPLLDGVPLDARFERRRFTVKKNFSNLPSSCPKTHDIEVQYDFEGFVPGRVYLLESMMLACPGRDYCKGSIGAQIVVR